MGWFVAIKAIKLRHGISAGPWRHGANPAICAHINMVQPCAGTGKTRPQTHARRLKKSSRPDHTAEKAEGLSCG
jgi:hypothetical protein